MHLQIIFSIIVLYGVCFVLVVASSSGRLLVVGCVRVSAVDQPQLINLPLDDYFFVWHG